MASERDHERTTPLSSGKSRLPSLPFMCAAKSIRSMKNSLRTL